MCALEAKQNENEDIYKVPPTKYVDIGKYAFEWECGVSTEQAICITMTETISKDRFSCEYTSDELKALRFFKPTPADTKQFIERILFNHTQEMWHQIGFIDRDKDNQTEGRCNELQSEKYTENDQILIILSYLNEWIQRDWELCLEFIPHTKEQAEQPKLHDIMRDLQWENRRLRREMQCMKDSILPKGSIVMWSGDLKRIPQGWALCDGSNANTPDLRDRFVFGAGNQHRIGDHGGNDTHTHNVAVASTKLEMKHMPPHRHKITRAYWDIHAGGGGPKYRVLCANNDQGGRVMSTDYVGDGAPHDHSTYTTSSSHLPPFVALAFIMKL